MGIPEGLSRSVGGNAVGHKCCINYGQAKVVLGNHLKMGV